MKQRGTYAHDSYGKVDMWVESDLVWADGCYVVTIKTNDVTDAHRAAMLDLRYLGNPTFTLDKPLLEPAGQPEDQ